MDKSQWFALLRGKLKTIPLSQRRGRSEVDLLAWAGKLGHDPDVVTITGPLPPFEAVKAICRDLVGKDATA